MVNFISISVSVPLLKTFQTTYLFTGNSEEIYLFPQTCENGSDSNISVRLCEIEDSELEEFLQHGEKYCSE